MISHYKRVINVTRADRGERVTLRASNHDDVNSFE